MRIISDIFFSICNHVLSEAIFPRVSPVRFETFPLPRSSALHPNLVIVTRKYQMGCACHGLGICAMIQETLSEFIVNVNLEDGRKCSAIGHPFAFLPGSVKSEKTRACGAGCLRLKQVRIHILTHSLLSKYNGGSCMIQTLPSVKEVLWQCMKKEVL